MAHYCDSAPGDPLHAYYHDHEYGFPVTDDCVLFERLALEINQAGLSWALMLKKRAGFRAAFKGFIHQFLHGGYFRCAVLVVADQIADILARVVIAS